MTTLYDIYLRTNLCKKFYLTIHHSDGKVENKIYKSYKDVYSGIIEDFPPRKMMELKVISQKIKGSNIFLDLVEHPSSKASETEMERGN